MATLYRNLVKERLLVRDIDTLYVLLKGGDWAFGSQLVDGDLGVLDTPGPRMPLRIFTPPGTRADRREVVQVAAA